MRKLIAVTTILVGLSLMPFGAEAAKSEQVSVNAVKLDINKVSLEQLVAIKGLGQKKAESILRYVQEYGPLVSLDELTEVRGIGPKLLAVLSEHLTVSP